MERYLKELPIDVYIYLRPNPDLVPEHKEPQKTLEWFKENAKDMSFNGLKDDLINLSSMLPYSFEIRGQKYEMKYTSDRLLISSVNTKKRGKLKKTTCTPCGMISVYAPYFPKKMQTKHTDLCTNYFMQPDTFQR